MAGENVKAKGLLTDFDGKFDAKLFEVRPIQTFARLRETGLSAASISYLGRIKARYDKDVVRMLTRGMLIAVRNFKSKVDERLTLFEVARTFPLHYGMEGMTEDTYYPFQHEVAEQAVRDWETKDTSTMQILVETIPINFDIVAKEGFIEFERGWTHPVPGEKAWVLSEDAVEQMYNRKVLKEIDTKGKDLASDDPKQNPRIGIIEMFEGARIPIFVNFKKLVRYHFGVFAYTGGGKSNLVSNIVRRLIYHTRNTNILMFDIASEYVTLLLDILNDKTIPSVIVSDSIPKDYDEFYQSSVKPDTLEPIAGRIKLAFKPLMAEEKFKRIFFPPEEPLAYSTILENLDGYDVKYAVIVGQMKKAVLEFMRSKGIEEEDPIGSEAIELSAALRRIIPTEQRFGPVDLPPLIEQVSKEVRRGVKEPKDKRAISVDELIDGLQKSVYRLVILNITDPVKIRKHAVYAAEKLLEIRRKTFRLEPYVLLVFDEAQEFIPAEVTKSDWTAQSSFAIENLLRHGRKYGLGGCISTQRIAHLNTNALQQLHSYFIGTLPRPYDRLLMADTFAIPNEILEKTLEFGPGEWLLSSYNATGIPNVPIFVKADNAETPIELAV